MGLMGFLMHKSAKSSINKIIVWYEQLTPDLRASLIFYIWLLRGLNLAKSQGNLSVNIPIYFYSKGAEVPLTSVRDEFSNYSDKGLFHAASHHLYTNLAVTYPDDGYGPLVRKLWGVLFHNHTDMREAVSLMQPVLKAPKSQELITNNDISIDELAENPKAIIPHFMVPGHKLSAKLMEDEKLANLLLNR